MNTPTRYASDVAFTPAVKALQTRKGSRTGYSRIEQRGSWETQITAELQDFIAALTSIYMATASAAGQPYIQHRGGPAGFLHVLDARTLAFADYTGNKQYISAGNLSENPKAQLFLMDYESRRRVKIWGEARVIEGDDALLSQLASKAYGAQAEQAMVFTVTAWDTNCPQHIPVRLDAEKVTSALDQRDRRIQALEARLVQLGEDVRGI